MVHAENIVAMFKQDTSLYDLTGELISDERFVVRMGMAVLFEKLKATNPEDVALALPELLPLLQEKRVYIRGEAVSLLITIDSPEAAPAIKQWKDDPDPQVAAMVGDYLG
jgi:HEAT repeat protein